jgi:AcrR family transcriptional regulator
MVVDSKWVKRRKALIDAALVVLAERGLAGTRVEDVAQRAGISTGHVLYYFESKADLFLQTLHSIESDFRENVRSGFDTMPLAADRWSWLLEVALPDGPGDVRLLLWLEAWERAPRDERFARELEKVESQWMELLCGVLHYGESTGEFHVRDLEGFAVWFSALIDGLTIQVVTGSPTMDRARMLEICHRISNAELQWDVPVPSPSGPSAPPRP